MHGLDAFAFSKNDTHVILRNTRETAAFGGVSLARRQCRLRRRLCTKSNKNCAPIVLLKPPQGHDSSKYVFSFGIGQREGGFYTARIEKQTESLTHRTTQYRISI